MKIGAQLYTVRDFTQTEMDLAFTLKKIAQMGYRYVHCSKVGPIPASRIKSLLDENNLQCVITNISPERLLTDLPTVIQEQRELGCANIGLSIMPDAYRGTLDGIKALVRNFNPVLQQIRDAGMFFHYHNHDVEFIREGRQTLLDILLEEMPEMRLLLCAFWAQVGGASPISMLERYADRIDIIHLKDMAVYPGTRSVGNQRMMTPVLEGNMEYDKILRACEAADVSYGFVEQDICQGSAFDCMETSLRNIRALGYLE